MSSYLLLKANSRISLLPGWESEIGQSVGKDKYWMNQHTDRNIAGQGKTEQIVRKQFFRNQEPLALWTSPRFGMSVRRVEVNRRIDRRGSARVLLPRRRPPLLRVFQTPEMAVAWGVGQSSSVVVAGRVSVS